jgi:thiosulfate/3-mercaptopyruvate sulfurtransferase
MKRIAMVLAALMVCATTVAADVRSSMLVSTAWLADHLRDPDLVLLHVGEQKAYDEAHLPGARFVSLDMVSVRKTEDGLSLQLLPVETLAERLEALGISNASRIVIYFGSDWVTPTTRLFFTLDYIGLGDRTSILDGGMPAWVAEKRPVTADVVPPARGRLVPKPRPEIVADAEWMRGQSTTDDVAIVDSRDPQFYDGSQAGSMPRAGRIPKAKSVPFSTLVGEDNRLKSPAALRGLLDTAGVKEGQPIVTYCHIGQQATLGYFVARYLGHPAKVYDGSFQEWSRHADWPIETGAARPK